MTYRELLEFTKKYPNPFWNKEEHEKEVKLRYLKWMDQWDKRLSTEEKQ